VWLGKELGGQPTVGHCVIEKLCEARVHACLQMRRRGRRREMRRQSRGRSSVRVRGPGPGPARLAALSQGAREVARRSRVRDDNEGTVLVAWIGCMV
jgi:hypothetical protein